MVSMAFFAIVNSGLNIVVRYIPLLFIFTLKSYFT